MTSPDERVAELLTTYGASDASVARLLCDRHCDERGPDAVAFTVIEADLSSHDVTFGELRERSQRFAAALAGLGVGPGDRVATLMGKSADLVAALLGIWRLGAVHVPLFTAFAPPAIALRLVRSKTKVVVVDSGQRAKLVPGRDRPDLPEDAPWRVIVAGGAGHCADLQGDLELDGLLARSEPQPGSVAVGGDAPYVELFTSGTTGTPKGVPIPVRAIAAFRAYFEYGLDVRPDDVFWNAADPGWAYGLYYGITAPLAAGHRSLLLHAAFSPELTWQVLSRFGVTNFTGAPTIYRALRNADAPVPDDIVLRCCSSAGEPLNPDVVEWAEKVLGVPVRDHYGQTELGMSVINGWHPDIRTELRPGSMGRSMPGWRVEVLAELADEPVAASEPGRVAVHLPGSPLMWFTGYVDAPDKTAERFSPDGRWYYTGDAGRTDEDGFLYFSARDDDVIIMAGYRIGPFEIESALLEHPDVAETAVVGVPDPLRGEVVEAYVVPRPGAPTTPALVAELQQLVKQRFAAHAYPRAVHFVEALPKTPSGKIQRFVLRQRGGQ